MQPKKEQALMREYLLGLLDESLREDVEERIVCDSAFAERLGVAEDNLIDDYVFDGLSERERENFQTNFLLDDERRHKLMIAQAFEVYLAKDEKHKAVTAQESWIVADRWRNAVRFFERHKMWPALGLTAILLLVFFVPKITRLFPIVPAVNQERAIIERQLAELNSRPLVATSQVSMELKLQPTRLREGGELKKVVLDKENQLVRLQLEFSSAVRYQRYRTVVRTVEGQERFSIDNLKSEPSVSVIALLIPSKFLPTGDYEIDLQGISEDGATAKLAQYSFRLIKNTAK